METGRGSGGRAFSCKGLNSPAWWKHLQFGLFSVATSGPELVHQGLWYVLCCPVCGKVHIKHLLLLIGKSSLLATAGFL